MSKIYSDFILVNFDEVCKGLALENKGKLMDLNFMNFDEFSKELAFETERKLLDFILINFDQFCKEQPLKISQNCWILLSSMMIKSVRD